MNLPSPYKPKPAALSLEQIAAKFVRDQIARGMPKDGLDTIMAIVVHLKGLLAYYRDYRAMQADIPIDLSLLRETIDPLTWARLSNQKKRQLGELIEKEANASTRAVDKIIEWLEAQLSHIEGGGEAFKECFQAFESDYTNPESLAKAA